MKSLSICIALASLATAMPSIAQTSGSSTAKSTLSVETLKAVKGVYSNGHLFLPITSQEKAREESGMAAINGLTQAGTEALHDKNYIAAEDDFRQLTQNGSLNPNDYYGLGEALAGQGKIVEAIAAYKVAVYWPLNRYPDQTAPSQAIENKPNLRGCCGIVDAIGWMKCALLLSQTGQAAEALSIYTQAAPYVNNTDDPEMKLVFEEAIPSSAEFQANVHIALGLLTAGILTNDQAMTEFDQALQLQPDAALTNYYYGYGWKRLDPKGALKAANSERAKAALQRAAASENADVKQAAAKALIGMG